MSQTSSSDATSAVAGTFDQTSKLAAALIGGTAAVAGILAGVLNPFLNRATSTQGTQIDVLFSLLLGIAAAIFVIVQGFLLYSIARFGRTEGDESDGPPIRGNTRLEFFWTAIPALTVVIIAVLSYRVLADIERPAGDALTVEVTARQYSWEFYYPEQDVKANELHIPVDRQVRLKIRSADVIHSFWAPDFRIKKDAMPDRVTETFITGTELGTYPIVCTELCGAGHAVMRSQIVVHSDADFQNWIGSLSGAKARPPAAQAADPLAFGRQLFNQYACNTCHALADAGAAGQIGPKLDGIADRAGNVVPGQSAEEYLRAAIVKPNEFVVKGYQPVMPQDYGLRMTKDELDALVQYLLMQK